MNKNAGSYVPDAGSCACYHRCSGILFRTDLKGCCAGKGGRWREAYEKNTETETDDPKKIPGRDCDFKGQLGVISDRNAAYFGGDHRPDFDIQKSTDRFSQYDF